MVRGCWGTLSWPFYLNWFSVITWGIWSILHNTFGVILIVTHYWKLHISLLILLFSENTRFPTFRDSGFILRWVPGRKEEIKSRCQHMIQDVGIIPSWHLWAGLLRFGSLWQNTWAASKEEREVTALEADEGLGGGGSCRLRGSSLTF